MPWKSKPRTLDTVKGAVIFTFTTLQTPDTCYTNLFPPVALSLMCRAVMPSCLHLSDTSWAANIAAYGDASSRSAFTFMPPVTRTMVSLESVKLSKCIPKLEMCRNCDNLNPCWGVAQKFYIKDVSCAFCYHSFCKNSFSARSNGNKVSQ